MRELVREGARWRISEMSTVDVPGSKADRCLVFDGERVVRRVWTYPDDWPQLSDTQLWALLDLRDPPPRAGARPSAERGLP
jgi:hypothetical protein